MQCVVRDAAGDGQWRVLEGLQLKQEREPLFRVVDGNGPGGLPTAPLNACATDKTTPPLWIRLPGLEIGTRAPILGGQIKADANGRLIIEPLAFNGGIQVYNVFLPVTVLLAPGGGGLALDLGTGALGLDAGTLQAVTYNHVGNLATWFKRTHRSLPVTVSLANPQTPLAVDYEPAANANLPLYVATAAETADDTPSPAQPLLAALSAAEYTLRVAMSGYGDRKQRLTSLALLPGTNGTFAVRSHAFADATNRPLTLRVKVAMPLHVRRFDIFTSTPQLAAGLMLAPTKAPVAATLEAAVRPILGLTQRIRINLESSEVELLAPAGNVEQDALVPALLPIEPAIVSRLVVPQLRIGAAKPVRVIVPRPGSSYLPSNSTDPDQFEFEGGATPIPLLPGPWHKTRKARQIAEAVYKATNTAATAFQAPLHAVEHESAFQEANPTKIKVALQNLAEPKAPPAGATDESPAAVRVESYGADRRYGHVSVAVTVASDAPRDYVAIWQPMAVTIEGSGFRLDPTMDEFKVVQRPDPSTTSRPAALLKLAPGRTLDEIAAEIRVREQRPVDLPAVDQSVADRSWTGLILFDVPVDLGGFPLLSSMAELGALKFDYVASSPARNCDPTAECNERSITARLLWENTNDPVPVTSTNDARFRLSSIEAVWRDSTLQHFDAQAKLAFARFADEKTFDNVFDIRGTFDRETALFRFIGERSEPLELLPAGHALKLVEQIYVRRVEIRLVHQSPPAAALAVDGTIKFKRFDSTAGGIFDPASTKGVEFRGLRMRIQKPAVSWAWLDLDYPSLEFPLSIPALKLGFLDLVLRGIGVEKGQFPPPQFLPVGSASGTIPFFDFHLDLMRLPALALKAIERLTLELRIGIDRDSRQVVIGFRALGFHKLHLDLMRFLELGVESVSFADVDVQGRKVKCLKLEKIKLRVLGHEVVGSQQQLSAFLYSDDKGRRGCVAWLEQPNSSGGGWFRIHWILVGHNVQLDNKGAFKNLLGVALPESTGEQEGIGTTLAAEIANSRFLPRSAPVGEWLFAAGFSIVDLLQAKFLFQDGAFYGISIGGPFLKQYLGYDFGMSVIYMKGGRPEEDSFALTIRVPKVAFPAVALLGGEIGITIAMNGSFFFDAGFPFMQSGVRRWDRAFGAIMTPFQASGGFYIRKHLETAPGETGMVTFGAGYAVQGGLGASFGGGVFTVWATVGLYFIAEGDATFAGQEIQRLRLVGVVGILGQASGQLNWWVISVRVDILVFAEASGTVLWVRGQPGALLEADFTVMARASASACIGWDPFRVCMGIGVEIPMRFGPYKMRLA